jgi:hypothetical protein
MGWAGFFCFLRALVGALVDVVFLVVSVFSLCLRGVINAQERSWSTILVTPRGEQHSRTVGLQEHFVGQESVQEKKMEALAEHVSGAKARAGKRSARVVEVSVEKETFVEYSLATTLGQVAVDQLKQKMLNDPSLARKFFQTAGILSSRGKLTKRYGG